MSNAPHLLTRVRGGHRFGALTAVDHAEHDGLWCAYDDVSMGSATERYNPRYELTREAQDAFAAASHTRAARAQIDGTLAAEIAEVTIQDRGSGCRTVASDEAVRPATTPDTLARLSPAFTPDGTITAGNAPGVNDGAAAVVLASAAKARELGLSPLAEIGAHGMVAGPDPGLHEQPARALLAALDREGLTVADLNLLEINEAFAAVALVAGRGLGAADDIVNVDGGAIALGHPIGMTGARLVLHLAHALRRRGGGTGGVTMCGGGGQGDALILHSPIG